MGDFSSIILSINNYMAGGRAYLMWENTPILSLFRVMEKVGFGFVCQVFSLLASLFPLFCSLVENRNKEGISEPPVCGFS